MIICTIKTNFLLFRMQWRTRDNGREILERSYLVLYENKTDRNKLLGILILPRCRALNLPRPESVFTILAIPSRILIRLFLKILRVVRARGRGIDLHSFRFKRLIVRILYESGRNKNEGYLSFFSRKSSPLRNAKADPCIAGKTQYSSLAFAIQTSAGNHFASSRYTRDTVQNLHPI